MSFTDPRLLKQSDNLRRDMFMAWDGVGGNASVTGSTGCALNINTSAGTFYGDASVPANHYADLTDYSTLRLTFSAGSPRLFFNRQVDDDPNLTITANNINNYGTAVDDDTWIVDLDKVANYNNLGYVHLDAIKAESWNTNVTITSATLTGPSLRSLFHQWSGTGAGFDVNVVNPADFVWHVGEEVEAGKVIYGNSNGSVPSNQYADLTPYNQMVVTYDNTKQPPLFVFTTAGNKTVVVEVDGQNSQYVSVNGNQISINLAKLRTDHGGYVLLNAIKSTNEEGGSTIVNAVELSSFTTSSTNQRVKKTFFISDPEDWSQISHGYTLRFHFVSGEPDQWTIDLYNSNNQVVASLPVDYDNTENYWHDWKFGNNELNFNDTFRHFYVRWYLKDKQGNVVSIPNSLINSIYGHTLESQAGVAWSSDMYDDDTNRLDDILYMTVDGRPDGGEYFNPMQYDLACVISEAGNESYVNGEVAGDANPVNIEYTFHFEFFPTDLRDKRVTHKTSYLYDYAKEYGDYDLDKQGLSSNKDSDWEDLGNRTQRVNHFEITHYVKYGEDATYLLPTAQDSNDHTLYQRWYNYDDETDTDCIVEHVTLNGNGGSVPFYRYQNGLVTGDRIYWGEDRSFLNAGETPYAYQNFTYHNTDGKSLTVAADVSRYSDMTYQNPEVPLAGNLEEPSLTMRYIYYMNDARVMAAKLTTFPEIATEGEDKQDDNNWMESKVFHFPSRQLAYENEKKVGYRGEFIGLRHIFSDYWIFDASTPTYDANNPTANNELNSHLVPGSTLGNIVVEIYDPNNTGIRLGGYNPSIDMRGATAPRPAAVGDIIRVNITRGQNSYLGVLFKHVDDYDTWTDFTNDNMQIFDTYVEATIPSEALSELKTKGLRFQGTGFTITSVELIPQGGGSSRTLTLNPQAPVEFTGWDVAPTIDPSQFTVGENDYQGFYYHDLMYPWNNGLDEYGNSRFLVFRYPESGQITATNQPVYLRAYFVDPNNTSRRFQLAQYTLIFDEGAYGDGCATLPWTPVNGGTNTLVEGSTDQYSRMDYVRGTPRDPNNLRERAGKPIAKITFDYPAGTTYHFPDKGVTNHGQNTHDGESYGIPYNQPYPDYSDPNSTTIYPGFDWTIPESSPIPLTYAKSNYAFDGENALYGAYALLTGMETRWGNRIRCVPSNDADYGYGVAPDHNYQSGFLYIDASELPGDICSVPFVGDFCTGDHLMVSGWISGANGVLASSPNGNGRSPGGITLTLKGEHTVHGEKVTETLYRFCPGMCYELDNGGGIDGYQGANHVVWQQFYFEFIVQEKFDRHWIEVNNNCVSSQGGDFMLDNIEVYTIVPDIAPDINTPICVDKDGKIDMRLLKLDVDFTKMKSTAELTAGYNTNLSREHYLGMVFLEKDVFLKKLKEEVSALSSVSLEDIAENIMKGKIVVYSDNITHQSGYIYITQDAYNAAFDAALLRSSADNKSIWMSDNADTNKGAGLLYYKWSSIYDNNTIQPVYSFANAVNRQSAVFRETDTEGDKHLIFNGNYPGLPWKADTDYYLITSNAMPPATFAWNTFVYSNFNLCSAECVRASVFRIEPPYELLGLEKSEDTNDYMVCEGQLPTIVLDLKGYDFNGNELPMQDINFDWWLGDPTRVNPNDPSQIVTDPSAPSVPRLKATLENYHAQSKTVDGTTIKLSKALAYLRAYYPDVTSIDGVVPQVADTDNPKLTQAMIDYLKEVVDAGQLVLHQKSVNVPAEPASVDDPYFYLVACPIHDEMFNQALNPAQNQYVAFYCDEPQGIRVKLGGKAPTLKTGFVPEENGFESYNYAGAGDAILSIRLAKREQFETVKHGEPDATLIDTPEMTSEETTHFLWLPIRNAIVQTAESDKIIQKSEDENIYLASTNDPVWDKQISKSMKKGTLPIVGKIVQLNAIDVSKNSGKKENDYNRLCVYFTNNFDVREGYNYTLSMSFQESPGTNACDGSVLINLKIVPDYEVWTGGAGNTDWNNDENWRRADGNLGKSVEESKNGAGKNSNELYRTDDLPSTSPLSDYMTNYTNYRTAKDRLLRKGFAPLYCTHVLIKSNEWGDAPVLYDALDSKNPKWTPSNAAALTAAPFPNLRDKDGWDVNPPTSTDNPSSDPSSDPSETPEPELTKATATPILRYDMQARHFELWEETYGEQSNKGRTGDLIAEMYQVNSCDEIAFQPGAELLNAHLLNYNSAWVEYQLDNKRWYLLGSPLQGTISGEWYAPTGSAQQKTTYYEPVTFGEGYDRYSPAIYQRSWDKAKAVLYEVGANYSTNDNPDDLALVDGNLPGSPQQGSWNGNSWSTTNADDYLDRLGYKPLGDKKVNVAMKGIWSNTYNDATVDYTKGGFSVMVMNHLKNNDASKGKSIIRLPKEDTMYDYYKFEEDGSADGGTDTYLSDTDENNYDDVQSNLNRALNRGRLKSDMLLPTIGEGLATYKKIQRLETTASRYGDMRTYTRVPTRVGANALPMTLKPFTEAVSAGISNLGYYLVENPFVAGLDMEKFFAANTGLEKKYWILTPNGQQLVQRLAGGDWVSPTEEVVTGEDPNTETTYHFTAANAKVAPGQGFFVQATTPGEATTITFTSDMQAQTRYGEPDDGEPFDVVVGTKQVMESVPAVDEDGNGLFDEDNNPIMVEVPQVDADGNYVLKDIIETVTIYKYKQKKGDGYEFPLKARTRAADGDALGLVITAHRDNLFSSALVMQREGASDDFLPSEDTETFIMGGDLVSPAVPTVYTLCGRLATTINSIHDFRCLPLGVESNSTAPCILTFRGVEHLGDSVAFYDAVERKLTPLESGMKFVVSGQTQNRYYLVRSLDIDEAAEETHLQIFTEGLTAKVIASTQEPLTSVRCYDAAGRLVHAVQPQTSEYSFTLPSAGVYIIEAQTEHDRKSQKHICK